MTPEEMLAKLKTSKAEVEEFQKESSKLASRHPNLAALHEKTRTPAPVDRVKNWFGKDVTNEDISALYKAAPALISVIVCSNLDDPLLPPPGTR